MKRAFKWNKKHFSSFLKGFNWKTIFFGRWEFDFKYTCNLVLENIACQMQPNQNVPEPCYLDYESN